MGWTFQQWVKSVAYDVGGAGVGGAGAGVSGTGVAAAYRLHVQRVSTVASHGYHG